MTHWIRWLVDQTAVPYIAFAFLAWIKVRAQEKCLEEAIVNLKVIFLMWK